MLIEHNYMITKCYTLPHRLLKCNSYKHVKLRSNHIVIKHIDDYNNIYKYESVDYLKIISISSNYLRLLQFIIF